VAEHTAARSADPQGSLLPAAQGVSADLGARIAHAWSGERSTLDLLEPGLTLFASHDESGWEAAAACLRSPVPVSVRLLEPMTSRALGAPAGSAVLTRSDGAPVAIVRSGAQAVPTLRAAVESVAA
jgi:hypothetical protein